MPIFESVHLTHSGITLWRVTITIPKRTFVFLWCSVLFTLSLYSQPSNFIRLPKLNIAPGGYDTVGAKNSVKLAEETQGIVEKAIDPQRYLVGPNDVLTIAINAAQPLSFDVYVSPDAKVLVPAVPAVDVRGLTFAQAQDRIIEAVKAVYKTKSVDVLLKKIKLFKVSVSGAIRKPAVVPASSADRVSEVIDRAGGFLYNASLRRITIQRDGAGIIPVDILRYFSSGDDRYNPYVHSGDKILVSYTTDEDCVWIQGNVYQPGQYEFMPGDSLSTLLLFAQGFTRVSLLDSIEVERYEEAGTRTYRFYINTKTGEGNIPLKLGDKVYVRQKSGVLTLCEVAIDGGVVHPGRYSINVNSDRLADLIRRAGGYTDDAQPETGLLYRRKDFTWYDRELDRLSKMKQEDMNESEVRYYRTKSSENMGLVSVDFEKVLISSNPDDNPILVNKDSVYIPHSTNYVNLIGRVSKPGRIPYDKKSNFLDYIRRAGGFGLHADEEEVLIQKVSGELHRARDFGYRLDPGDNILVPEKSDVKFIDVVTKVLSITAQLATIVGVVIGVAFAYKK